MLKAAVIGLGDISIIHIQALQTNPDIKLVALCDIDESLGKTFNEVNFYTDYQVMLEKEDLDCVHICLPHHLHYPVTKACMEKGVHVLQEKPLALNLEEALEMEKLEAKHEQVKVCVCLQNRFNETFEKLLNIVGGNEHGPVVGIKGVVAWYRPQNYYETKPWRGRMSEAGGGVMINQSIHTLDHMQLLGGSITSIRGSADQLLDYGIEVEDTVSAHIRFENGARGLFFATVANAGNSSVELEVWFEKVKYTIKDSLLIKEDESGEKEVLVEDSKLPGTKFYYGASHASLIHHFYDCIRNDSQDYIHIRDAVQSIRMIDAIHESSALKKEIYLEGEAR
ncbi:Gfo/Idh/MocA family oxidoreductase [Paenibacillus sp. Marseille-Q4541]|uniref:Gfo/Idh/MocA family protein n=1 Tax=Paenibacillus sp. Marseille-Q4541 TaxID=2831522 RepID=UPI001BA67387|nr:Gfo/Idh/MocA family oxidoreductase [Paenibacillus sp. Marseille-Q4541]